MMDIIIEKKIRSKFSIPKASFEVLKGKLMTKTVFIIIASLMCLSIGCAKRKAIYSELPESDYENYTMRFYNNNPYYHQPLRLDSVQKFFYEISVEENGCYLMLIENDEVYKCCCISIINDDTIARYLFEGSLMVNIPLRMFKEDFCQGKEYKLFLPKVYYQK